MSLQVQHVRFRVRGRTAAEWTSLNEVLLERELGVETDTRKFKFGTGVTPWNALPYASAEGGGGVVEVQGTGAVEVDATDPARPVVSLSPGFVDSLVTEAPEDGKRYGRRDGAWDEIPDVNAGNMPISDQAFAPLTDQNGSPIVGNAQPVAWARIEDIPAEVTGVIEGVPQLAARSFADRPSASPAWRLVVLTGIAGGAEVCYSDGTDWRRCSDKTIASL